jgi:O-antigen ligase
MTTIQSSSSINGQPQQASHPLLWIPLLCGWILMIITLHWPGRDAPQSISSLDYIALAKVASRGVTFLMLSFVLLAVWYRPQRASAMRWLFPFGVFVAWSILSTLWSPLRAVSIGQSGSLLVLLMLTAAFASITRNERDLSTVLRHLSLGALFMSSLLVTAYFAFPTIGGLEPPSGFQGSPETGLSHPNTAGATASIGLVILVAARLLWKWRWTRLLLWPAVPVHVLLLYIAHNRLSFALALVLVFFTCCVLANRFVMAGIVFAGSALGGVYLATDPGLQVAGNSFGSVAAYAQRQESAEVLKSFNGRAEVWEVMWDSYLESPLIGHGYFVSSKTGECEVWNRKGNWDAHNMQMQVLVSTGLIGALLVTWGLLRPGLLFVRCLWGQHSDGRLGFLILLVIAWYLGWGLLCASFLGHVQPLSVIFYATVGVAIGNCTVQEEQQVSSSDAGMSFHAARWSPAVVRGGG